MLDNIKNRFAGVTSSLPAVPSSVVRLGVPLALAGAIAIALVVMLASQMGGDYRPLFGARENVVISDVVSTLEAEGLRYRLHPDSGQVLVAEGDLARARMALAAKGVVAKLPEGLELMDRNDPLGVSQFVQDVRFRRGLEGELSRSIATLESVQAARVHLSIARSSSFVVNTGEKSTASVVLQMKPGQQLQREQIAAIIHMVASSVAGMDPQQVSLTDQSGRFLSARLDLSEGFDPLSQDEQSGRVTEELRRNAQELLTAAVGVGNFRITVAAEVSQDRSDETYEKFSGDPRVLSEATREENERAGVPALGVPGSLSNRPVKVAESDDQDASGNFRAAGTRTYAYDRSVVQIKKAKGQLQKLSVAVVLDDAVAPDAAQAWSEADLQRIRQLMLAGLGVNVERGDQLQVSSLRFVQPPAPAQWWEQPSQWYEIVVMALWVIGVLVLLVLLWKVVGAVLRQSRSPASQSQMQTQSVRSDVEVGRVSAPALAPTGVSAVTGLPALAAGATAGSDAMSMQPLLENVDLPPPGSQVDVMVEHLRSLAAKEPERVAEVVKQWVQKHGQPVSNQ